MVWIRILRHRVIWSPLVLCAVAALILPGAAHAQRSGAKSFDGVIAELAKELVGQVDLKTQPVLVQSYGFYDSDTGLSLPLSRVLKDRVITALKRQGVRVLLQGTEGSAAWGLHGTWRKMALELLLDFRLVALREEGPEAVGSASGRVPLSTIDAGWLVPDRESWGRYLLRKLEDNARTAGPKSLHVVGVRVHEGEYASRALEDYLSEWLKGAFAESAVFRVVDPKKELLDMPVEQIRKRGLKLPAAAASPAAEDLTSALVQAEGELRGTAWIHPDKVEIRAQVREPTGGQLTYASADVPRDLFPPSIFKKPELPVKGSEARIDECVTRHGLRLELTTNAGERPEFIAGEEVRFVLRLNRNAYLYLFNINPDGEAAALYPVDQRGALTQKPPCGTVHNGGVPIVLPEDGCSYDLVVSEPFGKDRIWACASEVPLSIDPNLGGSWRRGQGLIMNAREVSSMTGAGYAEAFLDVITRPKRKQ